MDFTDFISVLCETIAEMVAREVVQRRIVIGQIAAVGEVVHTYQGGVVAIVRMQPVGIAVGDQLVILRQGRILKFGAIESIQEDAVERGWVQAREGQELGVRLNTPCRPGATLAKTLSATTVPAAQQPPIQSDDHLGEPVPTDYDVEVEDQSADAIEPEVTAE